MWKKILGLNAKADAAFMQAPPAYWRPVWRVNHLVYKGGVPDLKSSSLTGGGFIPMRSLAGHEQPGWQPYSTPVSSQVGGGSFASRPNFITPLGGPSSTSQF